MADLLGKVINLCKRRGFVHQTGELYAQGLKGCYDYGPLGAALKRNLAEAWWRTMVTRRSEVHGLDTSILTPRDVLQTSGHLANFTDPLVDCKLSKERFRADKAPPVNVLPNGVLQITAPNKQIARKWAEDIETKHAPGANVKTDGNLVMLFVRQISTTNIEVTSKDHAKDNTNITYAGYANPSNNSPFLTTSRQFNLLFSTTLGVIEPTEQVVDTTLAMPRDTPREELLKTVRDLQQRSTIYLRPETAQGAFSQFPTMGSTLSAKLPFGLAQIGKSFRNEINVEHYIFRTVEFEQMEMEYFCEPPSSDKWFQYWRTERMRWWKSLLNQDETLRFADHDAHSLAHYSRACTDIEFAYPWGWGELEGIAHRGDFDLQAHAAAIGSSFRVHTSDGKSAVVPHVIEPSAGLNRGFLAVLLDAYHETEGDDGSSRITLKLHPRLAPYKAAVFPLTKDDKQLFLAQDLAEIIRQADLDVKVDTTGSVGKRYARHDEIGTPVCFTIDDQTKEDGTVTWRDRDTKEQFRIRIDDVTNELSKFIRHVYRPGPAPE